MNELVERLDVIERMIQEGRRSIERWGWVYVMWGVGHVLGVLGTLTLPTQFIGLTWAVLMTSCGIAMGVVAHKRGKKEQVEANENRALNAVWWTFGLMLVFLFVSPPTEATMSMWYATFCAAYGAAFFASGHIIKWMPMKMNGLLWLSAGVVMKFLGANATLAVFAGMAAIGEIGFGLYAMAHEKRALTSG